MLRYLNMIPPFKVNCQYLLLKPILNCFGEVFLTYYNAHFLYERYREILESINKGTMLRKTNHMKNSAPSANMAKIAVRKAVKQ